MTRQTNAELLERVAQAVHSATYENARGYPLPIDFYTAGRVLAALGLDDLEARVARLEAALQQLRVHATNPDWTTPAGALALVNEIEAALTPPEDDRSA
jgi:hypothetical protein